MDMQHAFLVRLLRMGLQGRLCSVSTPLFHQGWHDDGQAKSVPVRSGHDVRKAERGQGDALLAVDVAQDLPAKSCDQQSAALIVQACAGLQGHEKQPTLHNCVAQWNRGCSPIAP